MQHFWQILGTFFYVLREKYGAMSKRCNKILTLMEMNCSHTVKTYLKGQNYRTTELNGCFLINLLVTTGCISQWTISKKYRLSKHGCIFLNITMCKILIILQYYYCKKSCKSLFTFYFLRKKPEERNSSVTHNRTLLSI